MAQAPPSPPLAQGAPGAYRSPRASTPAPAASPRASKAPQRQHAPHDPRNDDLNAVFGQSYFDFARDHNCDLDTVALLRARKLTGEKPLVLVHIDYHADIMRNNEHISIRHEGIGNYINRLISDATVSEVYWVLPDHSASAEQRHLFWDESRSVDVYFNDGPRDQTLWVDPRDGHIAFSRPHDVRGLRAVQVHKRLLSQLPSFATLDAPLWIDIDADFFSNTGLWTRGKASLHYGPGQLEQELARFVRTLREKGARPALTTGCLSPGFTHADDLALLRRFFYRMGEHAKTGECVVFRHRRGDRGDAEYGNRLHGRVVALDERPQYRTLYRLEALDATHLNDDGRIGLRAGDRERDAAIRIRTRPRHPHGAVARGRNPRCLHRPGARARGLRGRLQHTAPPRSVEAVTPATPLEAPPGHGAPVTSMPREIVLTLLLPGVLPEEAREARKCVPLSWNNPLTASRLGLGLLLTI
ncbi:MAG: hypothetical protein EB084_17690 [Proteobacteria bacterium]|nr:hypothetical protein [Pseudomonadota bacterium]